MSPQDARERGTTLLELIVAMGIGVVVTGMAVYVIANAWNTQARVTAVTTSATQTQAISQLLDRDIRTATGFSVPSGTSLKVCLDDGDKETLVVSAGQLQRTLASGGTTSSSVLATSLTQVSAATPYFTKTGSRLDYAFSLEERGAPVIVQSSVLQREGSGTCS